jgi:hypothetical protein
MGCLGPTQLECQILQRNIGLIAHNHLRSHHRSRLYLLGCLIWPFEAAEHLYLVSKKLLTYQLIQQLLSCLYQVPGHSCSE